MMRMKFCARFRGACAPVFPITSEGRCRDRAV
jgi:hypothetical protein